VDFISTPDLLGTSPVCLKDLSETHRTQAPYLKEHR